MQVILNATPLSPSILRWNYAGYQVIAERGPHGGLWNSAAAALAEWGIFSLAFVLVALFFFGARGSGARLQALAAAVAAVIALLVNHLLGLIWYEPRPYLSSFHVPLLAAAAHGNSFPSDHLAFGGAIAAALWVTRRRWLALLSLAVMCGVGWARILAGIHWPLDVIVGLAIGLVIGALIGALAAHAPWAAGALDRVRLPRLISAIAAVVVVGVGFAVLEKATHVGIVVGPIVLGVVLMALLGAVWSQTPTGAASAGLPS